VGKLHATGVSGKSTIEYIMHGDRCAGLQKLMILVCFGYDLASGSHGCVCDFVSSDFMQISF